MRTLGMGLQPLAPMVAAPGTYGCSPWHLWLQAAAMRTAYCAKDPDAEQHGHTAAHGHLPPWRCPGGALEVL